MVVGVLASTQHVVDQLILTSLESIWEVHAHDVHHQAVVDAKERGLDVIIIYG